MRLTRDRWRRLLKGQAIALGCVALATLARYGLTRLDPQAPPFAAYFLAVLATAFYADTLAGATALILGAAASWFLFIEPVRHEVAAPYLLRLAIYAVTGGIILAVTRRLQDARHALRAIDKQRASLLAEMNHRVKNNFQMIASLLELQARRSEETQTREQLAAAVHRINVLAELHANLTEARETQQIDFRAYLAVLCEKLRGAIERPGQIVLRLEAEDALLPTDKAVPLGFVINEIVTNAIKHAFADGAHGEILIAFRRDGANYRLTVRDNGRGVNDPSQTPQSGLGSRLIAAFAAQAGATMTIDGAAGLRYDILVPCGGAA